MKREFCSVCVAVRPLEFEVIVGVREGVFVLVREVYGDGVKEGVG